jgi:hypothetical protein
VGTNTIQEIEGEWLQIENAIYRDKDFRYNDLVQQDYTKPINTKHPRAVDGVGGSSVKTYQIVVPLGMWFSKHPSQYLPLAAIAGCNDIKVAVKLRQFSELVYAVSGHASWADTTMDVGTSVSTALSTATIAIDSAGADAQVQPGTDLYVNLSNKTSKIGTVKSCAATSVTLEAANALAVTDGDALYVGPEGGLAQDAAASTATASISSMVLRGTYIHLPGPEAEALLSKDHVRLVKHHQRLKHHIIQASQISVSSESAITINLSFLNPVTELIVVLRAANDLTSYPRSYFSYLGKPKNANQGHGGSGSNQANPESYQVEDSGSGVC